MNRVILSIIIILVIAGCVYMEIQSLPCKHENTHTVTVESTCVKAGTATVVCDDCGETLSTRSLAKSDKHVIGAGNGKCSLCGVEKCEKGGNHTFTTHKTKPSTCLVAGFEWKKCSKCGYDKMVDLKLSAHTYEEGACTVCGDIDKDYVPKTGDNSVVIMASMVIVAMVSALSYVYIKKETSSC